MRSGIRTVSMYDAIVDSGLLSPEERTLLRAQMAYLAYQMADPQRWDVIVFKYPGDAKTNYIKRLIGLPGETIQIRHGDIHVRTDRKTSRGQAFRIARKPPEKVQAMLQRVDDTSHIGERLRHAGWPVRWTQASSVSDSKRWRPAA